MSWLAGLMLSVLSLSADAFCFDQAGREFNVNPQLLRAIAQVESAMNPKAMNESHFERTKTVDIGLMQINSGALTTLAKQGITQRDLIENPCLNVKVGALILAEKFKREGPNWEGVGAYNAACTQLKGDDCRRARNAYTHKVWKALNQVHEINTSTEVVRIAVKSSRQPRAAEHLQSRIASIEVASADSENNLE